MMTNIERGAATLDAAEPDSDDRTIARLAALSVIEYERVREAEAEKLEVRVGILDKLVAQARGAQNGGANGQGKAVLFVGVEPWGEAVDGAALLTELVKVFKRYLVLPVHAPEVLALWVLHTHVFDVITATPYLAITSPQPECGKTRLLEVLQCLCRRGYQNTNLSPAVIYRVIEKHTPTLLIDEFETFHENEELRGILNAGYTRAGAVVPRCVGDNHEIHDFSVWAPKAFGLIGKLPATLQSRSLGIEMKRRLKTEPIDRINCRVQQQLTATLARKCVRWAQDNLDQLKDARPPLPEALGDRQQDVWEPSLAIAEKAGDSWLKKATDAALALAKAASTDSESTKVLLLADLQQLFEERNTDRLASKDIVEALAKMEERPWPAFGKHAKPITQRQLASLLSPFGIVPGTKREGHETFKGYLQKQFADTFSRYLPGNYPSQSHNPIGEPVSGEFPSVTWGSGVTDGKTPKPAPDKNCDGVTAKKGVNSGGKGIDLNFEVL
jgi:putative DNA primase/helicase